MDRTEISIEYLFRASPGILYEFLTTPACLVRWFCEEVDITKETYSFYWGGSEEVAKILELKENEIVKFHFDDYEEDEYLLFEISKSPVTGETILNITDFCDDDEVDDQMDLWDTQMAKLRKEMGG